MFGGYVDLYAYGGDSNRRHKSATDEKISESNSSGDKNEYDCCTTSVLGGFRSWSVDRDDFILIGECEEIQGPSTFLLIPESAGVGVDTNGLILQLLSSDYQGLGEGSAVPYEDTQSFLPDIQPNIHVVVNYFVLMDVQARGYVRPMCVAYVTANKFKLAKMFIPLRNALVQACTSIKSHNWRLFCEELKPMIADLTFTQKVRENVPIQKSSVVEKMQDENLEEALRDLKSKLDIMAKLVEQERKRMDDNSADLLKYLRQHCSCPSYAHFEALLKSCENTHNNSDLHEPQILKVPLRQNFGSVLRPVTALSSLGLPGTVFELYKVLRYFERHYETVALTARSDDNIQGLCLHFGACVKEVCSCSSADAHKAISKKSACHEEYRSEGIVNDVDEEFFKLFQQLTKRSLAFLQIHSKNEFDANNSLLPSFENYVKILKRHNLFLNQLFDVVEKWQGTEIEETVLSILQSIFHKEELLYSLLRGRIILIIASADQRQTVEAVVAVLSVIVPTSSRYRKMSELWTSRDIQESDLSKFAIIGMQCSEEEINSKVPKSILPKCSVLNMKKKKLSFPHYKGELLTGIAKTIKSLSPKGPLLSVLVGFLSDLELKVQLFRLLIEARGEINALRYFFNKGFSEKDTDLLWRLNGLLE